MGNNALRSGSPKLGTVRCGSPDGTTPSTRIPCPDSFTIWLRTIAPTTAIRAPGIRRVNRRIPTTNTITPNETSTATTLVCGTALSVLMSLASVLLPAALTEHLG